MTWEERLNKREKSDLYRQLRNEVKGIDFTSNDYLGLSIIDSNKTSFKSSTGSRLLSGNQEYIIKSEAWIAEYFGYKTAVLFTSGYQANLALFSAVLDRNSTVFYDEYCHASIRDGIQLSHAKSRKFSNNNLDELEQLLKSFDGKAVVALEALYSMDGTMPNADRLKALKQKYDFYLVVDEAHSFGVMGADGKGWAQLNELDAFIDIKLVTFGKAAGYHGAVILCSKRFKAFLCNFSRPFIYSTGPDEHFCETVIQQIKRVKGAEEERKKIADLNAYLKEYTKGTIVVNDSPIAYVPCPGNQKVSELSEFLYSKGIDIRPIKSPTVPEGKERLRLCLHAYNTREEVNLLLDLLP